MKGAVCAEQALCAVCLFIVLVAIIDHLRGASQRGAWREHRATVALLVVAGAVRLAMPRAFIHANFHGYGLVEAILAFPEPAHYRAEYGQGSFMALGALATALGGGWRSVVLANVLFGTALLSSMALLAHRIAGPFAATATAAAGAMLTPLVRVAASEDAHNVASLLAVVALLAAAPSAAAPSAPSLLRSRVIVILAATLGAVYSRQSWFFLPLIIAGLTFAEWRPPRLAQPRVLSVVAVVVLLLVPRGVSLATTNDQGSVAYLFSALFTGSVPIWLRYHPLFRLDLAPCLLVFGLVGVAWTLRARQSLGIWVAIGAVTAFASSLVVSANPSYGVAYGFRLPLFTLLLPLTGAGCAAMLAAVRRRAPALASSSAIAAILALFLWPAPGLVREARLRDPQDQEYAIIARRAATLPRGATLLFPRAEGREPPSYSVPQSALGDAGVATQLGVLAGPTQSDLFVFEGLSCYAYSLSERTGLLPSRLVEEFVGRRDSKGRTLVDLLWTTESEAFTLFGERPPEGRRQECARAVPPGSTFEEWGRVDVARRRDLPFVYFSETSIGVGVWRAPRAAAP
jgi:hypothetical protein